ncbi:MAG: hypothetical protein V4642_01240 [Bacteroidota bacterium]
MLKVIDANSIISNTKKKLPNRVAFCVDTNIVIYFKDPFGESLKLERMKRLNPIVERVISILSSQGITRYTTHSVVLEYFNHIRFNQYRKFFGVEAFNFIEYKKARKENPEFLEAWQRQLLIFNKLFKKTFKVIDSKIELDCLDTFDGTKLDYGDHLILQEIYKLPADQRCLMSDDKDLYYTEGDCILISTNQTTVKQAASDGNLL